MNLPENTYWRNHGLTKMQARIRSIRDPLRTDFPQISLSTQCACLYWSLLKKWWKYVYAFSLTGDIPETDTRWRIRRIVLSRRKAG